MALMVGNTVDLVTPCFSPRSGAMKERPMRTIPSVFVALLTLTLAGCVSNAAASQVPVQGAGGAAVSAIAKRGGPHAGSVVVVIMENRDYNLIIGSKDAPYINGTLVPQAALMTDSHGITHPSQPNYLGLFSGSTQGIKDDSCPHTFTTENLGAEVIAAGGTFDGYSESMPKDGYTGCTTKLYARKHNPWVDFKNVPASSNLIWYDLPGPPPSVSIIVPNLCNDMHDCSTKTGDDWLKANLPAILASDSSTSGLLILTWDEADPDRSGTNQIATLLLGPMIVPGQYGQKVSHYNVLSTIEAIEGVKCTASACKARVLAGMWN
jgi:phosphatidylinositol-3-phosphatase